MANINRLINNISDPSTNKALNSIFENSIISSSSTPIPNQVLPAAIKADGTPVSLYFVNDAFNKICLIEDLAQKQTIQREKAKKPDRPIEFLCTGYVDFAGDLVINKVYIPALDFVKGTCKTMEEAEKKFSLSKLPAGIHSNLINEQNKYLKNTSLGDPKSEIGQGLVTLLGTTKPDMPDSQYSNCFKLSELADSVINGDNIPKHNIVTGTIATTPYTIEKQGNTYYSIPGSIECTAISYDYKNNGKAFPTKISNIISCYANTKDNRLIKVKISQSSQPTNGLVEPLYKTNLIM